jgi:hypothetical protein
VEEDYHLFLEGRKSGKGRCLHCAKETNFKLFDGYFHEVDWCCSQCYDEKYGPRRKKA